MGRAAHEIQDPTPSGRTPADVSALLIELGRAIKGGQFYPAGHPARDELLDRSWRAWQAELERHGPLDLEVRRGSFWLAGSDVAVGRGRLDALAREFVLRAVRRMRFAADLDASSFRSFIDVLVADRDLIDRAGGVERAFYSKPRQGIELNEMDYGAVLAAEGEAAPETFAEGEAAPGTFEMGTEDAPQVDAAAAFAALFESNPETEERESALSVLLRELEACEDDIRYEELAFRVVEEARAAGEESLLSEGHRAAFVLSAHASEEAPRSHAQRTVAAKALRELVTGPLLAHLTALACGESDPETQLRTTQIFLELGNHVVPRLLDAIVNEANSARREPLAGILLSMGEALTAELPRAVEIGPPLRARAAIRLAGESQNPSIVPTLRKVLSGRNEPLHREAAKALARIGTAGALDALGKALESPIRDVPLLAALSLGATGSPHAVPPLAAALTRAVSVGRLPLARDTIRALGRLGRPEAAEPLAAILSRRAIFRRRRVRELKLAAAAALGRVPGEEARRALAKAARSRDAQLRQAAARSLERHPSEATSA